MNKSRTTRTNRKLIENESGKNREKNRGEIEEINSKSGDFNARTSDEPRAPFGLTLINWSALRLFPNNIATVFYSTILLLSIHSSLCTNPRLVLALDTQFHALYSVRYTRIEDDFFAIVLILRALQDQIAYL